MTTGISKLPREGRTIRMDPDLAQALEDILEPHTGKTLERAQAAIVRVRASGFQGSFGEILEAYRVAIEEAVSRK